MRNLISLTDLTSAEVERIFSITEDLKTRNLQGERDFLLPGRVLALLFEKPSLRTRVSFESAIAHLGGVSLFLSDDVGFGKRESMEDFARVLGEFVDAIVIRAKKHAVAEQLAQLAGCAVINGLTDLEHPCQALADLYTLREIHGTLRGKKLAYVGDGNNVARSLALGCGKVGVEFALAAPPGYEFDTEFSELLAREVPELKMTITADPREAVADAAGVYTDVWASMGQEAEQEVRQKAFADYQVNAELMAAAPEDACFLHCLPARRGEEVSAEVIDGPRSVVVQQAGNRMHVQKGILAWLLGAPN
ncbi:MAG: ornithine carbamoyltransferase [Planctomycetales bacterium]|nr:ornithine carbamoyltransferase [Planctomycetales bacterium]